MEARVVEVQQGLTAMLLDSPHSGTDYPDDFGHNIAVARLREAEDTHVEKLFAPWVTDGATLIAARFPRSYIDCNRAADDIDVQVLDAPWTGAINPSRKAALGKGLIWRCMDDGTPIYTRKLAAHEVHSRIARCWQPYWRELAAQAARIRSAHGKLFHINCHSMPSRAAAFATDAQHKVGAPHPDFVVGDRDGTTCDQGFSLFVTKFLRARGYRVTLNDPYKGVEIVRVLGQPCDGQHSLQLEVNRRLYMDESTRELHVGFEQVRRVLAELWRELQQEFNLRS
jgi:N-formylglutamate amidohydrolase